ncbi:hypothetical protein [Polynucleobacter antarcticus]|uniref:hypothetical protein n=1 Tax=Polynucleobacter antarcticus TaxID=1743162 RepID=UPI0039F01C52
MNFARKPTRRNAAHEWLDYLRDSQGLGGILAKTEDLAKLKTALNIALTTLDLEHFSSKIEAGWRSGGQNELFLLVSGATIATRLQQVLPSLINELSKKGVICLSIKVRIKPAPPHWEIKARTGLQTERKPQGFNPVARASWESLLEKLDPDSDLREAVEKLLKNKAK